MRRAVACPMRVDLAGYWTSLLPRDEARLVSVAVNPGAVGTLVLTEPDSPFARLQAHRQRVQIASPLAPLAGLAASSAHAVAWTTLIGSSVENVTDRKSLAGAATAAERVLGTLACPLDAYACATGGITSISGLREPSVRVLGAGTPLGDTLLRRLIVVSVPRLTRSAVLWREMSEPDEIRRLRSMLSTMKSIAEALPGHIVAENWQALAEALADHWAVERQMGGHPVTREVDDVLQFAIRHGAQAGKLCGSGGSLLLMVDPDQRNELRDSLHQHHLHTLAVSYAQYGVQLKRA